MRLFELIFERAPGVSVTTKDVRDVKRLYDAGVQVKQIALDLGMKYERADMIIRKYLADRVKRKPRVTTDLIKKLKTLYDQGLPTRQIADKLGMDYDRTRQLIFRHHPNRKKRRGVKAPEELTKKTGQTVMDPQIQKDIDNVKELFDKHFSYQEIADKLSLPLNRIKTIISNHYTDRERRTKIPEITPQQEIEMGNLFSKGYIFSDIAEQFKLSTSKAYKVIRALPNYEQLLRKRNQGYI